MREAVESPRQQAQKKHDKAVRDNAALGVIEWNTDQRAGKQSERVFQIVEGKHRLPRTNPAKPGERMGSRKDLVLGPGQMFHPTEAQVQQFDVGRGGLKNKVRELTEQEYAGVFKSRDSRKPQSTGADIGLRSLKMDKDALKAALDAKLDVKDFADTAPVGKFGRYTLAQVEDLIQAKGGSQN